MNVPVLVLVAMLGLFAETPVLAAGEPPFTIVENGKTFWRLDDAVVSIEDRTATIRIAPGVYKDCAHQHDGLITYVAAEAGTAIFDGGICDDKATLVLGGRGSIIDGLVFRNMRNDDNNGAGIRLESGPLEVKNTKFQDSQEGILTADDPSSAITVDRSTFSGLGNCDDESGCAHGIYVGMYGSLTVTHSRFDRGTGGHYLKSRATRIMVSDSSFDDTKGTKTNYMIDLPAGAKGSVLRNTFVVGPNKDNHSAIIAVAAESRSHPSIGLVVADNTASLAPGIAWSTTFVADWSHEPLAIGTNALGKGIRPFEIR